MALILLLIVPFLLVPASAFAWGPLTHMYLGSEVFYLGSLLPAGVYSLIRKYRQDFLYGNLMADIILGKKYLPRDKNPHNWDVAIGLVESAKTEPEEAFALGYMSHLAADTVAHGRFTRGSKNMGHAALELKADSIIDRKHWVSAVSIGKDVQKRNDLFMERSLDRVFFSFNTNKRIFKGWVALSGLNRERLGDFMARNSVTIFPHKRTIESLHEDSLDRVLDILQNGKRSEVLKKDPIGDSRPGRILGGILK